MITEKIIQEAVERLVQAANPEKIFLFGSYARGDINEQSDPDFLIVQKAVKNRRRQTVHLQDILRLMRIPEDIVVVSRNTFQEWENVKGTVFYEAKREGILYYDTLKDE